MTAWRHTGAVALAATVLVGAQGGDMDTAVSVFEQKLQQVEQSGKLADLEIEYWTGGGQPPPYYKSDQLRFLVKDGKELAEFASLKFDSKFNPPNLQDKWTAPLKSEDARETAKALLAAHFLTAHPAEERKPGIADIISYEVILTLDGKQEKRTYYRNLPAGLAPLKAIADRVTAELKSEGKYGLYHQGKEIQK